MSRFVIIGAGAVGSVLGSLLLDAGHDIVLVATERRRRQLAERGLRIITGEGVRHHEPETVTALDEVTFDGDTTILLALKTQHVAEWLRTAGLARLRTTAGASVLDTVPIVTLQNGLGGEFAVARLFRHVHGATVYIAANHLPDGDVISGRAPVHALLALGRFPEGADETTLRIRDEIERSPGIRVEATPTILAWKAKKLVANASNGLDLFDGTAEQLADYTARLETETRAVLDRLDLPGIGGDASWSFDIAGFARDPRSGIRDHQRSLWQNAHRLDPDSEIDFLNGEVRMWGTVLGAPTPWNDRLQRVVGEQWHRLAAQPGPLPFALLEEDHA